MAFIRVAHLKSRVSLIVSLSSAFTGDTAYFSGVSVWLEGVPAKPVAKADGVFVFGNLQEGTYRLHVSSDHYFAEQREVTVHANGDMVHMALLPLPSYPFRSSDTLLRLAVGDREGRPVESAVVTAVVTEEEAVRAKLAQEQLDAGSQELHLGAGTGPIRIGDRFQIRNRSSKPFEELIQIAGVIEHGRRFRLANPLLHTYTRGAYLLPVVQTRTTVRGEAVIAFSGIRLKQFAAQLRLHRSAPYEEQVVIKETMLEEGKAVATGRIIL